MIRGVICGYSDWVLNEVYDINLSGQIIGYGTIDGEKHAFLIAPVPIPGANWLLGTDRVDMFVRIKKRF